MTELEAVQYKCPACGAGLKFDAEKQDFICEYCDSVFKEEDFFKKDETLKNHSKSRIPVVLNRLPPISHMPCQLHVYS